MKYLDIPQGLTLESGYHLPRLRIAYNTYGALNADGSNAIWVCHALTSSSDVADWWPHTVEKGKFLDPDRYFVVCANILGSCYGTTSPLSVNPATGQPYYDSFPVITIRDQVRCHQLLARHLGIRSLYALIGSSMGGYQALEWLVSEPQFVRRAVLIATAEYSHPWLLAFNETMLMALEADKSFGEPRPDAGAQGLACARAIGLLSYRGQLAYDLTQADPNFSPDHYPHRACTYQRYQGKKLVDRFNAYSYRAICQTVDSHNIARGRASSPSQLLASIKARTLVVAISSDLIFPPEDMRLMSSQIPASQFEIIDSPFAHDGFLVEHEKLNSLITSFFHSTPDEEKA